MSFTEEQLNHHCPWLFSHKYESALTSEEPFRWAELCCQKRDPCSPPRLQPWQLWDFCAVIKGRVKSKREAGRPGPSGGRAPSHHSPIPSSARQLAGPRHGASGHWRRRAPHSAQGGILEMSCAEQLILKEGCRVCPDRKASTKHEAANTLNVSALSYPTGLPLPPGGLSPMWSWERRRPFPNPCFITVVLHRVRFLLF